MYSRSCSSCTIPLLPFENRLILLFAEIAVNQEDKTGHSPILNFPQISVSLFKRFFFMQEMHTRIFFPHAFYANLMIRCAWTFFQDVPWVASLGGRRRHQNAHHEPEQRWVLSPNVSSGKSIVGQNRNNEQKRKKGRICGCFHGPPLVKAARLGRGDAELVIAFRFQNGVWLAKWQWPRTSICNGPRSRCSNGLFSSECNLLPHNIGVIFLFALFWMRDCAYLLLGGWMQIGTSNSQRQHRFLECVPRRAWARAEVE